MFAQLLITIVVVMLLAELLARLIFRRSFRSVLAEIFRAEPEPPRDEGEYLRDLVAERRRSLVETREKAKLTNRAADVTDLLTRGEDQLHSARERLTESDRGRDTTGA